MIASIRQQISSILGPIVLVVTLGRVRVDPTGVETHVVDSPTTIEASAIPPEERTPHSAHRPTQAPDPGAPRA